MPYYKKGEEFYSPLKSAKNTGSAKSGVHHWIHQRLTAVALLILLPWALWSIHANILGASYDEVVAWLSQPLNAILSVLFIITVHYHALLGVQVIVEDYVHKEWLKIAKLVAQKLFYVASAIACIYAVFSVEL